VKSRLDRIITLITDFGTADGYVGAMKGVILSINPRAVIVDISHDIQPQNILQAVHVLDSTHPYYPRDSIHVVVVDPGVGTDRKALVMRTRKAFFIAPDNGVLSHVDEQKLEAVAITNSRFWRKPVSATFHGRDIFAPVAAQLSLGTAIAEFGEPVSSLVVLPRSSPNVEEDGTIVGHVIHIDRFGNLITDVRRGLIPAGDIRVEMKGHSIKGLSGTYAEGNGLVALVGSDDSLEIGLRNGNAASFLNAALGDRIEIRLT